MGDIFTMVIDIRNLLKGDSEVIDTSQSRRIKLVNRKWTPENAGRKIS